MQTLQSLTLYVIRHGECEHNLERRIGSQSDSPLTALGRSQAQGAGRLLREVAPDLASLDYFASPLHRTCVTMELLREAASLPATEYRADHRLMEIHAGDHIGLRFDDIPEEHHVPFREDFWNASRPGGESRADVHARTGDFLRSLTRDCVIVTHGVTAQTIRAHYLGLSPDEALRYQHPNAAVLRLSLGTESTFGE